MKASFVLCTKSSSRAPQVDSVNEIGKLMKPGDELMVIENTQKFTRHSKRSIKASIPTQCAAQYISIHKGTLGRSRNIAFQKATGDVLIFVDDDVIVNNKIRTKAFSFFNKHKDASIYVNPFRPFTDTPWSVVSCAYWNQALIFRRRPRKVRAYPLACSAFRMAFIRKNHIQCDESIFTGEDMDLLLTVYEHGGTMYFDPSITHTHHFATSGRTCVKKHFLYGKNYMDLQRLHPKTYLLVDNVYNYVSQRHYPFPLNYLGSIRRIMDRSREFMNVNRLAIRFLPHVLTLMTALAAGVYASKREP